MDLDKLKEEILDISRNEAEYLFRQAENRWQSLFFRIDDKIAEGRTFYSYDKDDFIDRKYWSYIAASYKVSAFSIDDIENTLYFHFGDTLVKRRNRNIRMDMTHIETTIETLQNEINMANYKLIHAKKNLEELKVKLKDKSDILEI